MRSVTANPSDAARAHLPNVAADGTPRRGTAYCTETLVLGRRLVVGIDDARDEWMAHHVLRAELRERDAAHAGEDAPRLDEAALLPALQIDLRHVAVYYGLGAEADARKEHLHLLGGRVLRFVQDDERVVERAPAHVGERRELDRSALEELAGFLEPHEVIEGVVQRAQVRIDLLREIARQEAEALARLDRGAHEHDALHLVALERIDGAGDREEGLARAGGADTESKIVGEDVLDVLDLVRRSPMEVHAPGEKLRTFGGRRGTAAVQELVQFELHVVERELAGGAAVEVFQCLRGALRLVSAHGEA